MKYYIYISDTKLEMLYGQIPRSLKSQIATEIKIDLKIVSTTFTEKDSQVSETKYSRMEILANYLKKHAGVSDVDDDEVSSYFRGTILMKWGPFSNVYSFGEEINMVFFGGQSKKREIGLGGSLKHVIGSVENEPTNSASATAYILDALLKDLSLELGVNRSEVYAPHVFGRDDDNEYALMGVSVAIGNLRGPAQKVEFLAKTLLQGKAYGKPVLLGTPIYVALAE